MKETISIASRPMPYLLSCKYKIFENHEVHCTRNPNYFVLILMMEGVLKFMEEGKEITLTPERWYIQRRGVLHAGTCPCPGAKYFYVHFHGAYANSGDPQEAAIELPLSGSFSYAVYQDIMERLQKYSLSGPWDQLLLQSTFLRLLGQLCGENTRIAPQVKQILSYIKPNQRERITSAVLAKEFNFSEKYIERIVKEQFHMTPHQYLTYLRLENAKLLLDQTNIPLKDISESSGFTDPSLFYRAFVKSNGISPRAWRKELLEQQGGEP